MPLSKPVIEFLGTEDYDDDLLDQKIGAVLTENSGLSTELEGLRDEKVEMEKKIEGLEALKPMAEIGETYLADQRKEAERLYRLLKGDEASESMIKLIQSSDVEQAKTYVAEFNKEVEEKIPGVCSECGKPATLTRRSSKEIEQEQKKDRDSQSHKMGPVNP
jgi:ATP phosphoribosyltransferase regulatory subunit HisZ